MVVQTRGIITEEESNRIKSLYGLEPIKRDYIFEACTTVDGRYFIMRDEVFDIQEQKLLGNLWSSIDIFKNIFSNVSVEDETGEYTEIKESIISLPILEGKENLYELRDILLEWSFWEDTWLGDKLASAGKSIKDAVVSGWEGLKEFGIAISKGDWSQILSLLGKGIKWILRKLKSALYSTLGMIVDAILVATGIGKAVQWIPWALVTALDVYQLAADDWPEEEKNDPLWMKFLTLGFDVLGLVTTAAVAKGAKAALTPLKTMKPGRVAAWLEKNPTAKSFVTKIINGISKVPSFFSKASSWIASKFPKGAQFIKDALSKFSGFMNRMKTSLQSLIGVGGTKAVTAAGTTGGLLYGFEKGAQKYAQYKTGLSSVQLKNMETLQSLEKRYGGKDPFD